MKEKEIKSKFNSKTTMWWMIGFVVAFAVTVAVGLCFEYSVF